MGSLAVAHRETPADQGTERLVAQEMLHQAVPDTLDLMALAMSSVILLVIEITLFNIHPNTIL